MNGKKLRSTLGIMVMSIFFIGFNSSNILAQSHNQKVQKSRKVAVKSNRKEVRRNARFVAVPKNARVMRFNNIDYRFYNGNYYRPVNGGFILSEAPVGIQISTLPRGYTRVRKHGTDYYYIGNTFYKPIRQKRGEIVYQVVRV